MGQSCGEKGGGEGQQTRREKGQLGLSLLFRLGSAKQSRSNNRQDRGLLGPFHILLALSSHSIQLRAGIELVKAFVSRGCTTKAAAAFMYKMIKLFVHFVHFVQLFWVFVICEQRLHKQTAGL